LKPAARAWILAAVLGLFASHGQAGDSLYARIGGEAKLHAIVDEFSEALWIEPQLAPFYQGVTKSRFRLLLQQQFCQLSGGDCSYEGEGMREVHAGLKIRQTDFYRLVELLRTTLTNQKVALRERNELLALLAPMKRDVIDRP
jgi:hemoglobin